MNALELAEMLEHEPDISEGDQMSVALMLRKQHEAIKTLRDALGGVMHLNGGEHEFVAAFKALTATESLT